MPETDAMTSALPSTGQPPTPGRAGTAGFVVLVLALSGLRSLSTLLERRGATSPEWLDPLATLLGGGFSPLWAMLVVGGATLGWPAVRRLLRHSLRARVGLQLYVAALVVPFAVLGLAVLATGTRPGGVDAEPLALAVQILLLAPLFALTEQLGWRAWLQRGLQARIAPVLAGTLVGLVWVVHHLPLFASDSPTVHAELPFMGFLVLATVFSVLLAAVFNASGGSVLPVVVAHVSWNVAVQLSLPALPGESTPLFLAAAALFAAVAAFVARWSRANATERCPAIL